ncbi:hypothetical protein WQ54_18670 [Bacillus sp. SA1-12]|nr:hypothetical protein WQ54_18670 [Bacillus sp. SA1-12]
MMIVAGAAIGGVTNHLDIKMFLPVQSLLIENQKSKVMDEWLPRVIELAPEFLATHLDAILNLSKLEGFFVNGCCRASFRI